MTNHERAVDRLVASSASTYWALPVRARGDFVVATCNAYIRELGARRPALPLPEVDRLALDFGRRLVKAIDFRSGDPVLAARIFERVAPVGRA